VPGAALTEFEALAARGSRRRGAGSVLKVAPARGRTSLARASNGAPRGGESAPVALGRTTVRGRWMSSLPAESALVTASYKCQLT